MIFRTGFVSNSSSTSYVVKFPRNHKFDDSFISYIRERMIEQEEFNEEDFRVYVRLIRNLYENGESICENDYAQYYATLAHILKVYVVSWPEAQSGRGMISLRSKRGKVI